MVKFEFDFFFHVYNSLFVSILNQYSSKNKKNSKIKSANNLKKRSLLILENNDYIEYLIKNNDNDDNNCCSSPTEKLMYDINDKMASLWTKNGYRNSNENNDDCGHQQNSTSTTTDNLNNDKTNTEISSSNQQQQQTCAQQATLYDNCDSSLVIELAAYLDETLYIPKKMSFMAEMMYT